MDEEFAPNTELNRLHKLDYLPIQPNAKEIGDILYDFVDTPFKYEQLRSPQLYSMLVRPIVDRIRKEYLNGGVFYCLLANRIHFFKEGGEDLANSKLWSTRAMICEVVAIKLLNEFKIDTIAQNFAFEFYPLSDGKITTLSLVPNFLRVSAFELAIHSEAKMLLSHPVIVSIIAELWEGTLIYDPLIYKAHKLGINSHNDLNKIIQTNRGLLIRYDLESDTKFKLSRLRVPKYRNVLKFCSILVLVGLYVSNLQDFDQTFTIKEYVFLVWSTAFALDEFVSLKKAGSLLYFNTLWAPFDFATAVILLLYTVLRLIAKLENSVYINSWAYQVLATAGVLLIPRTFSFLDASQDFSSMMISARKMSIDLTCSWAVIVIFSLGFWASLSKFADGIFSPVKVFGDQVQILFGFTPAVWQTWREYPVVGRGILFLYLFVVQFVVTTMVIAALSARYSEISARASEEYHFVQTIQTITKLKSERSTIFFFAEPFNLIGLILWPLKRLLSINHYILLNRAVMRITQMPILVCIYIYERTLWRLEVRKKRAEELQIRQLRQHVKTARESSKRLPRSSWMKQNKRLFERSMQRTSKIDLVSGALEAQIPSEPSSSGGGNARATGPNRLHHPSPFKHPNESILSETSPHPLTRGRSYSTTSSILQNYNTFKLSPTMGGYPPLHRLVRDDRDDEDAVSEGDGLLEMLQDLDDRSKHIEGLLEVLFNKLQHVDAGSIASTGSGN